MITTISIAFEDESIEDSRRLFTHVVYSLSLDNEHITEVKRVIQNLSDTYKEGLESERILKSTKN